MSKLQVPPSMIVNDPANIAYQVAIDQGHTPDQARSVDYIIGLDVIVGRPYIPHPWESTRPPRRAARRRHSRKVKRG